MKKMEIRFLRIIFEGDDSEVEYTIDKKRSHEKNDGWTRFDRIDDWIVKSKSLQKDKSENKQQLETSHVHPIKRSHSFS